jgi:uncharacterized protein
MERLRIGEVPALAHVDGAPEAAARRGTVLVYHPLGAGKDLHTDDLRQLAAAGFLAIGVDAIAHGERRIPDAYARFRADPFGALLHVVAATAAEVPGLLDALVARRWAVPGRIGIAGISLGGFVAYGAAASDRRIAAAACLNASPCWGEDPRSPHARPEAFFPLALLSLTAAEDPMVPPGEARALHAALAPRYAAAPERLRYLELPGETHRMSAGAVARARAEAVAWFQRFLGPARPGEA